MEVTGRTLDEAKEAALARLGVLEADAEVIVLSEGRTGLFGRLREEARVRARVRPVRPRPKRSQRPRVRRGEGESVRSASAVSSPGRGVVAGGGGDAGERQRRGNGAGAVAEGLPRSAEKPRRRRRRPRHAAARASRELRVGADGDGGSVHRGQPGGTQEREEHEVADEATLAEQGHAAQTFLEGLFDAYGLDASVTVTVIDDETVELSAQGEGLGLLIGPRGTTLAALQEVTRTAVQRQFPTRAGRIVVDAAGYRGRRAAALQRFTTDVAEEVRRTGEERALEPMSPADRKVVHDTVNALDGVRTRSEGEEPARFVVIAPGG